MVLIDASGEKFCYSADITRCYPISGKFSSEARVIYEIVLKMQQVELILHMDRPLNYFVCIAVF